MNPLAKYHPQSWPWEPTTMNTINHHYYHYQNNLYPSYFQSLLDQKHGSYTEREHMFEKLLTPSDVGKLNRLVIPKQNAEKYFPLDSHNYSKGLLLSFEDESRKVWRFRYSYWTSSQSYVLTKGWSHFVKEKRLEAGDVVVFLRRNNRLCIDCRRSESVESPMPAQPSVIADASSDNSLHYFHSYSTTANYSLVQKDHAFSVPAAKSKSKRHLRLFGVNLECSFELAEPLQSENSNCLDLSMEQSMPSNEIPKEQSNEEQLFNT